MKVADKVKIAELNDAYRKTANNFMITGGVNALYRRVEILDGVRSFDEFNESNDPHGEHDFGSFTCRKEKIFWKIDYYDQAVKYGIDPLDPNCYRVLTIMLADEY